MLPQKLRVYDDFLLKWFHFPAAQGFFMADQCKTDIVGILHRYNQRSFSQPKHEAKRLRLAISAKCLRQYRSKSYRVITVGFNPKPKTARKMVVSPVPTCSNHLCCRDSEPIGKPPWLESPEA